MRKKREERVSEKKTKRVETARKKKNGTEKKTRRRNCENEDEERTYTCTHKHSPTTSAVNKINKVNIIIKKSIQQEQTNRNANK